MATLARTAAAKVMANQLGRLRAIVFEICKTASAKAGTAAVSPSPSCNRLSYKLRLSIVRRATPVPILLRSRGMRCGTILWSSNAEPGGVTPIRKTPTWQLSCLPSRPLCCRATPAKRDPFLVNEDSSITPTTPIGEPAAEGVSSSAKSALDLGHHVVVRPGGGGDELLHALDVAAADQQGDRLDALAVGADHQAP